MIDKEYSNAKPSVQILVLMMGLTRSGEEAKKMECRDGRSRGAFPSRKCTQKLTKCTGLRSQNECKKAEC